MNVFTASFLIDLLALAGRLASVTAVRAENHRFGTDDARLHTPPGDGEWIR
jgi:hypothetical protein